jgi:hypothetical protein
MPQEKHTKAWLKNQEEGVAENDKLLFLSQTDIVISE